MDDRIKTQLTAKVQVALRRSLLGEVVKRKLGDAALDELTLDAATAVIAEIDIAMCERPNIASVGSQFCTRCHAQAAPDGMFQHQPWCLQW